MNYPFAFLAAIKLLINKINAKAEVRIISPILIIAILSPLPIAALKGMNNASIINNVKTTTI